MTVLRKRRGEHLRQGDVIGCRGCEVGESVRDQLVQISLRKKKMEEEVPGGSGPQDEKRSDPERREKAASAAPPITIAPPKA